MFSSIKREAKLKNYITSSQSLVLVNLGSYIILVARQEYDLTIFSVATDRYLALWSDMVQSYLDSHSPAIKVQWIVFTDKPQNINSNLISKLADSLSIVVIDHLDWPFPTLMRYHYLSSNAGTVLGRLVMHLDADMLFLGALDLVELENALGAKGIGLVKHPGYFRSTGIRRLFFYILNVRHLAKDVKSYLQFGALGTWERNRSSKAFVPRRLRKNYVCGGMWIGRQAKILQLCKELSKRVDEDLDHGIIAVFHDESYLNWYQAKNQFTLLSPQFCFEPSYPQLRHVEPKIQAVNKNSVTRWKR